ncbi:MAG: NUDIX domain-containing protein, partial [Acidobacteriota bacterium]|nr:NUDIX domain-containing protein [Acidobacteriota bacterium]
MPHEPSITRASRVYPDRPFVGVGAVVLAAQDIVLVKRRFEPLADEWSLPGGALELGETMTIGVAREIQEETSFQVEVGPVIDVLDRIVRDDAGQVQYHYVLVDFLCRVVGGTLAPGSDVSQAVLA